MKFRMTNWFRFLFVLHISLICTPKVFSLDLPFLQHLASEEQIEKPYSINLVHIGLNQAYQVDSIDIAVPQIQLGNIDAVTINSDTDSIGFRVNAWVLPFLRVFALASNVSGSTNIDLSSANLTGLPFQPPALKIDLSGEAYGAGFDLVCCSKDENWFVSLSYSYTVSSQSAEFDSEIKSTTIQPRVGIRYNQKKGAIWLASFYLDSQQEHSGSLDFNNPLIPLIPVSARISADSEFSYGLGSSYQINDRLTITAEYQFISDSRDYKVISLGWSF